MKINLGVRGRFLIATSTLAIVLVGGFTLAILQFLEVLEGELLELHFGHQFDRFVSAVEADPAHPPALPADYQAFLVEHGDFSKLPAALREVPPGLHAEYVIDGREYTIGRRDRGARSYFLLANSEIEPVERLEDQLLSIAAGVGGLALLIAVLIALWLARLVIAPVRSLAKRAGAIVPGAPRSPLVRRDGDPEIEKIARAFDRTLDSYEAVIAREVAFTRDASHELRTPLAVQLTSLELLREEPLPPVLRQRFDRIQAATLQIKALVDGLLFLARPRDPRLDTVFAPGEVIRDAIQIQQLAYGSRAVEFDFEDDPMARVRAPRGLFLCVVNNLLRNALEHAGGRRIRLTVQERQLLVADDGPGIPAELGARIFEPDVKGATSEGSGHGLYIVRRICEHVGWHISVEYASPAAGACFTLVFGSVPSSPAEERTLHMLEQFEQRQHEEP